MNIQFPELETVLDDWVRLKKSSLRTRKIPDSLILKLYAPVHSIPDPLSPLHWRKKALLSQWSGTVIDIDMHNGSALLGLGTCKNLHYIGVIYNYRHRDAFERVIRILGINATLYSTENQIPAESKKNAIFIRPS